MTERAEKSDDLPSPFAVGRVLGGKYRVTRKLGSGTMGIVVSAEHGELGMPVALKILNPILKSNKEALARFTREAKAMFTLKGEHVGRVFDVGRLDTGEPFIVMELLQGQTLKELVTESTRPPLADSLLLMKQICEAVGEAHTAGIIHRDLKPENIFVTKLGAALHAKVIDFGVSKARFGAEMTITDVDSVLGTPRYMAPEQFLGAQTVSARSDVWSLGVLMYRLLTGQFPFDAKDVAKHIEQIKTKRPPAPHALHRDVSPALSEVVMRCLSVSQDARYADANELGAAITAAARPGASFVPAPPTPQIVTMPAPGDATRTSASTNAVTLRNAPVTVPVMTRDAPTLQPLTEPARTPPPFREEVTIPRRPLASASDDPTTAFVDVPTERREDSYGDVDTSPDRTLVRPDASPAESEPMTMARLPPPRETTLASKLDPKLMPATDPMTQRLGGDLLDDMSTAKREIPTIARPAMIPVRTSPMPTPFGMAPVNLTPSGFPPAPLPAPSAATSPTVQAPLEKPSQEWSSIALAVTFGAIAATLGIVAFVRWKHPTPPIQPATSATAIVSEGAPSPPPPLGPSASAPTATSPGATSPGTTSSTTPSPPTSVKSGRGGGGGPRPPGGQGPRGGNGSGNGSGSGTGGVNDKGW